MWDYKTKLEYLNQHGESFKGVLRASSSKPSILENVNLSYHLLGISYYNGEEDEIEVGRFSNENINEILSFSGQPNLDALGDANLEVHINVCTNHLFGFRFNSNLKMWIAEYESKKFRFN